MGVPRPRESLSCADASVRLGLMADGELGDTSDLERGELSELRGHVAVCADCQAAWNALVDGKRALVAAAAVRRDSEFVPDDVLAAIDEFAGRDVSAERVAWVRRLAVAGVVVASAVVACW